MTYIELAIGLLLLLGGGEILVKGSVAVAMRLGVSPLVIGLTLVGFGTSTPELVASLEAALIGAPAIALGNVVGSNIANILLILGLSAMILPVIVNREAFRRDGLVLIATSALLLVAVMTGMLGRFAGAVFVALLLIYTGGTYVLEKRRTSAAGAVYVAEAAEIAETGPRRLPLWLGALLALGGIAGVVIGADLLVNSAIVIAEAAGISQAVIGLTLVAIGTSLPELAVSVLAAIRKHGDIAFGNIVGSNIFNILGIAGITAVVSPFSGGEAIPAFDFWAMLVTALLLVAFAVTGWRISRTEGALFLAGYAAYLTVQFSPGLRAALGIG